MIDGATLDQLTNVCMIVCVEDVDSWPTAVVNGAMCAAERIPADRRPTMLHRDRAVAETEAKRLASAHPGSRFAIFEACVVALTVNVPTHMTLNGRIVAERQQAQLFDIQGDGRPPF